jgi:hypothetical protein
MVIPDTHIYIPYPPPPLLALPLTTSTPPQGLLGSVSQEQSRRALPPEGWEGEVVEGAAVYVNVRQYHAILRRRRQRARAEAENKVLRVRKVTHPLFSPIYPASVDLSKSDT